MRPTVTPPVEKQHRHLYLPLASGGLGREVWAALLRVRIWPECPKHNLSELTWASKPDFGITTTQKGSPNLRHHQTGTQNKGLTVDCPILRRRQAGEGSQSRKGAIAAPERHYLPNCKQAGWTWEGHKTQAQQSLHL